ncbi:MAG: heme-binding domain-containing protein [Dehalococcoidia bacterium]|nr:heme-binding domain-containing protein [Dehalococcoidia bacterium]
MAKPFAWLVAMLGILLLIQLIPYGRNHTNPPVAVEPSWDSAQTRELAVRACYDCHSNETVWTWYSNIAPASWIIQLDVDRGRARLNFSEWNRPQRETREIARPVQRGEMPQWYYVLMHPSAGLSSAEVQALANGLNVSLAQGGAAPRTGN